MLAGKIHKIYEPNKNEIILDIYNKNKFFLDICINSSNCRINLTNHLKDNPKVAPNFCMVLRKYLSGSRISSIYSHNLDRIVIIAFENYNDLNDLVNYKLVIELMGKHSNIILVNKDNIIIDSLRRIYSEQSLRTIMPANPYSFPISNKSNLEYVDLENFINQINAVNPKNLTNTCTSLFTGISKCFMKYTLEKLNIPNETYNKEAFIKLYNHIQTIIHPAKTVLTCNEFDFNNKKDFVIDISSTSSNASINSFVDNFYFNKENEETFLNYKNTLLKLILSLLSRYNKKLDVIKEKLDECKDMDKYKLHGELITSNLYRINNNINIDSITLENYYDNNNSITIGLDKSISPSYNAKKFFKKYNKLKNTLEIVTNQKSQIQNEINYLESIVYTLESCSTVEEIDEIHQEIENNILGKIPSSNSSKKSNKSSELATLNIDGNVVYIGKNNTQNDLITFKMSDKNDIWFHVQGFHGSHVLLKTNGKEILDDNPIILKCAKLASLHSKANNENKVAVDYTLIKNIKKPKGAKPGFVVFNNYKTIIVDNNK